MALVISGGHTNIVEVTDYNECHVLGSTRDDAAGEAYDKVARVLGLGYPGGPLIDKLAKEGDPHAVEFKRVFLEKGSLDFSFSGIKTGVLNYMNSERQAGREPDPADVAASFQAAVLDVIVAKNRRDCGYGGDKIVLAEAWPPTASCGKCCGRSVKNTTSPCITRIRSFAPITQP